MNKSTKPELSFDLGANHLHGVLRADQLRTDTLTQLVQHWGEEQSRDDIIAALDELAEIVCGVRREGELDAAVLQVEDVAGMDTAQLEVDSFDVRRLLAELTAVERVTSRFMTGVRRIGGRLLPGQQDRRRSA
ncbi:hypothetical protein PV755_46355 [Streptomyces caniscabiei]|uniref:hypothetical protein n=1 Tax=Streptomyces caniscabiei TaxID=2746961 RepID=UPI0029A2121A|nr:hypothetical protein [Streptomyces caniscabiei]MDX3516228.1 hypothetical protein [Streptomyces caniscabiei]MDX3724874.1 hypothetical protein [Streptomyces caniscabiei]